MAGLLDLGLGAQVFLELGGFHLLQLLRNLRLDFFELGQLCLADVVEANDVPARPPMRPSRVAAVNGLRLATPGGAASGSPTPGYP